MRASLSCGLFWVGESCPVPLRQCLGSSVLPRSDNCQRRRVCWLIQCVSPCFRVVRRSENGCFLHSVALFQLARGPHLLERPCGCRCLGFTRCLRSSGAICALACCVRFRRGDVSLMLKFHWGRAALQGVRVLGVVLRCCLSSLGQQACCVRLDR